MSLNDFHHISFWEETLFQCKWWSVYFTRHAIWSSTGIGAGSCPFFIIHSTMSLQMSFVSTTLDFTFTQNHEFPCSQSKQWRIQLLYRYKRAKTSRITVLNIRKLYLYFVYFKPYVYCKCMCYNPFEKKLGTLHADAGEHVSAA